MSRSARLGDVQLLRLDAVVLHLLRQQVLLARSRSSRPRCSRRGGSLPSGRAAAPGCSSCSPSRRTSRPTGRTRPRRSGRRTSCSARDRAPRAAPSDGSPRKSMPILSTSSSRNSGLRTRDLGHVLQDLAGHRADVGAAMAADLGLVAHAAERHAHELAVRSPSRSTGRARSCPRRAGRRGTGSAPSAGRRAAGPRGTRRCVPSPSRGRSGRRRAP